jgi:hypothetical protein
MATRDGSTMMRIEKDCRATWKEAKGDLSYDGFLINLLSYLKKNNPKLLEDIKHGRV